MPWWKKTRKKMSDNHPYSITTQGANISLGMTPIGPDALRPVPQISKEAWLKALLNQAANALEDPEIKPRVIELIKKAIPGRVFDSFADNILDMVIGALRTI